MFGTVAVDLEQELVGDAAQLPAQFARRDGGVELGALAHDRLDGVDVVLDQFGRHLLESGRVLVTVQNHGFAVIAEGDISHVSLNDGTCEGPSRGQRLSGLTCAPPRQLCRRRYVDGGIFDNAPVGLAVELLESAGVRGVPFQPATFVVVDPDVRRLEPQAVPASSQDPSPLTMIRTP